MKKKKTGVLMSLIIEGLLSAEINAKQHWFQIKFCFSTSHNKSRGRQSRASAMTWLFQVAPRPLLFSALPSSICLVVWDCSAGTGQKESWKHTHSLLWRRVPERSIICFHLLNLLFTWPHVSAREAENAILWLDVQALFNKIRSLGRKKEWMLG